MRDERSHEQMDKLIRRMNGKRGKRGCGFVVRSGTRFFSPKDIEEGRKANDRKHNTNSKPKPTGTVQEGMREGDIHTSGEGLQEGV